MAKTAGLFVLCLLALAHVGDAATVQRTMKGKQGQAMRDLVQSTVHSRQAARHHHSSDLEEDGLVQCEGKWKAKIYPVPVIPTRHQLSQTIQKIKLWLTPVFGWKVAPKGVLIYMKIFVDIKVGGEIECDCDGAISLSPSAEFVVGNVPVYFIIPMKLIKFEVCEAASGIIVLLVAAFFAPETLGGSLAAGAALYSDLFTACRALNLLRKLRTVARLIKPIVRGFPAIRALYRYVRPHMHKMKMPTMPNADNVCKLPGEIINKVSTDMGRALRNIKISVPTEDIFPSMGVDITPSTASARIPTNECTKQSYHNCYLPIRQGSETQLAEVAEFENNIWSAGEPRSLVA